MDIPKSKLEAEEHIAQIRKSKGLDGPEDNISDLEAALILWVRNGADIIDCPPDYRLLISNVVIGSLNNFIKNQHIFF